MKVEDLDHLGIIAGIIDQMGLIAHIPRLTWRWLYQGGLGGGGGVRNEFSYEEMKVTKRLNIVTFFAGRDFRL